MSNIITAYYNGTQVFFQNDAYLNATTIAKHFNKSPRRWLELPSTIEYIDLLSKRLNVGKSDILKTTRGINGGTWLHRRLAVPFARWINVEFAIWCDEQIEKILIEQNQTQQQPLPLTEAEADEEALRIIANLYSSLCGAYEMGQKLRKDYPFLRQEIDKRLGGHYLHNLHLPTEYSLEKAKKYVHAKSERIMFIKGMLSLLDERPLNEQSQSERLAHL